MTSLNLLLCGRQVSDGGWETICSAGERAGGKGERVPETKTGCCGAPWGGHWGINPAEWGHYTHTPTHTHLPASEEAGCTPGPPAETHSNWAPHLVREETPTSHTQTHKPKPNIGSIIQDFLHIELYLQFLGLLSDKSSSLAFSLHCNSTIMVP